jgi:type I restriction enzyme S subunit
MSKMLNDIFARQITGEWGDESDEVAGTPVLRTTNFTNEGIIDYGKVAYRLVSQKKVEDKQLKEGDIILEKSGGTNTTPVGRVVYCDSRINDDVYLCNNFTQAIRVDKNIAYPRYVFYLMFLLHQSGVTDLMQNKTTGIQNLRVKDYLSLKVTLPSLDAQERAVAVLDKANELIADRKRQLEQLDLMVKSRFVEMFGDPLNNPMGREAARLADITSTIQSGNTPKGGKQVYVESGITFFRSQNVWRNRIELDDIAFIDEKTHRKMRQTSLRHKDILITKTGRFNAENSSLGRAALFLGEDNSANINGHVYLVRLKEGVSHEFVLHILVSEEYRDYIRKVCVGGIDKRQINKEHLEAFPIITPPLDLQNRFADFVRQADNSKFIAQSGVNLIYNTVMERSAPD